MFGGLFAVMMGAAAYIFLPFFHDLILALVFTALVRPLCARLTHVFGGRQRAAAITTVGGLAILLLVLGSLFVMSVLRESGSAYLSIESWLTTEALEEFFFGDGFVARQIRGLARLLNVEFTAATAMKTLSESMGDLAQHAAEAARSLLSDLATGLMHLFLTLLLVFGFLVEGRRLKDWLYWAVPLSTDLKDQLMDNFAQVSRATFFGNGIGSALQGVLGGITMWAFDLSSPILWGAVMTVFAFLPVFGISVVIVPASLYLAFHDRVGEAVAFATITLGGALLLENVVKTKLISRYMHMNDLLIFFSIIGGIAAFGILGILYGPLILTLAITLLQVYTEKTHEVRKSQTS